TVYGPRQRPDMGFHKFIEALLREQPIAVYGDGEQTRDFTFIADAIDANLLAAAPDRVGVFNIGGGSRATLREVLDTVAAVSGRTVKIDRLGEQPGDVRHTWADTTAARETLGFGPKVSLREGLAAQLAWHEERGSR